MPERFEKDSPDLIKSQPIDQEVRNSMSSAFYVTKNQGAQPTTKAHYDLLVNKNPTASNLHSGLVGLIGIHEPHPWEIVFKESLLNQKSPVISNLIGIESSYPSRTYTSEAYQKLIIDPLERKYALLSGSSYPTPHTIRIGPLSSKRLPRVDPYAVLSGEHLLGMNLSPEEFQRQGMEQELLKTAGYTPLNILENTKSSNMAFRQQELSNMIDPEEVRLRANIMGFVAKARGGAEGEYASYISKKVGDIPVSIGVSRHPEALEALAARGIKLKPYIKPEIPLQFAQLLAETEPTEELILSQAEILERAVRESGIETPLTAIKSTTPASVDIPQYHQKFIEAAKRAAQIAPLGARRIGYQQLASISEEELMGISRNLVSLEESGESLIGALTEAEIKASSQRMREIDIELSKMKAVLAEPKAKISKGSYQKEVADLEHEYGRLQKRISPGATTFEKFISRGIEAPVYEGNLPDIIPTERFYKQRPFINYQIPTTITQPTTIQPLPTLKTTTSAPISFAVSEGRKKITRRTRAKAEVQIKLSQLRDTVDRTTKQAAQSGPVSFKTQLPIPTIPIGSFMQSNFEKMRKDYSALQPNDVIFVRRSISRREALGDILSIPTEKPLPPSILRRNVGYVVEQVTEKGIHLKSMETTMGGNIFLGGTPSTVKQRLIAAQAIPILSKEDPSKFAGIVSEIQQRTAISEADIWRRQLTRQLENNTSEAALEETFLSAQRALQNVSPEVLEHVGVDRTLKTIHAGTTLQNIRSGFLQEAAEVTSETVGKAGATAPAPSMEAAASTRPKPGKAIGMIEEAFMGLPRAARWGLGGLATAVIGAGLLSSSLQRGQRELKPDMIAPGPDRTPLPDGSYVPQGSPSMGGTTRIMDETVPGKGGNAYKVRIRARDRGDMDSDQLHQLVGQSLSQVQMPAHIHVTSQDHRKKIKDVVEDEFSNLIRKR